MLMYKAEIRIRYSSSSIARSIKDALSPDDRATTGTVRVLTTVRGRTLFVLIADTDRVETLQATIQDIFRCVHAAETSLTKLVNN
jgi:tRNA threonylcarbamoyladenosine modification (KEOPS) complex  Pcc1 subunit